MVSFLTFSDYFVIYDRNTFFGSTHIFKLRICRSRFEYTGMITEVGPAIGIYFIYLLPGIQKINSWSDKLYRNFFCFFMYWVPYLIQHCLICRPSGSSVSEDAGIELRTVAIATLSLTCQTVKQLGQIASHPWKLSRHSF